MQIPMKDPKVNKTCSLPPKRLTIVVENDVCRRRYLKVKAREALWRGYMLPEPQDDELGI